jgi:hypothetical protein
VTSERFKVGDLVLLSIFGRSVIRPNQAKVGIIVAGPFGKIYDCDKSAATVKYSTYDIMLGDELITDIPEDFVVRMGDDEHEENPRGLEEVLERDEPTS